MSATCRLVGRGVATIREGLGPGEWAALVVLTALFVYGEGVRALERRWVPHLIERARQVRDVPSLGVRLLAPLYGLSLIAAPRRELAKAWAGALAIAGAVFVVQALPDPWRGITDFAVAAALGWGVLAIARRAPGAWG